MRWPVILVSLATLALTYRVARFTFGRLVSALVVLVMSVDPTFMYLTKLDYGPVALMMVLKVTALLLRAPRGEHGVTAIPLGHGAACALGLFDKLNFIWFLLALVAPAPCCSGPSCGRCGTATGWASSCRSRDC